MELSRVPALFLPVSVALGEVCSPASPPTIPSSSRLVPDDVVVVGFRLSHPVGVRCLVRFNFPIDTTVFWECFPLRGFWWVGSWFPFHSLGGSLARLSPGHRSLVVRRAGASVVLSFEL